MKYVFVYSNINKSTLSKTESQKLIIMFGFSVLNMRLSALIFTKIRGNDHRSYSISCWVGVILERRAEDLRTMILIICSLTLGKASQIDFFFLLKQPRRDSNLDKKITLKIRPPEPIIWQFNGLILCDPNLEKNMGQYKLSLQFLWRKWRSTVF